VVLAKLHAAGFLPEVWQPDEVTERLRRHVARRGVIVQARTRLGADRQWPAPYAEAPARRH
jgi:hypothetical protein